MLLAEQQQRHHRKAEKLSGTTFVVFIMYLMGSNYNTGCDSYGQHGLRIIYLRMMHVFKVITTFRLQCLTLKGFAHGACLIYFSNILKETKRTRPSVFPKSNYCNRHCRLGKDTLLRW